MIGSTATGGASQTTVRDRLHIRFALRVTAAVWLLGYASQKLLVRHSRRQALDTETAADQETAAKHSP